MNSILWFTVYNIVGYYVLFFIVMCHVGTVYAPLLPGTGILLPKHFNTLRMKHVDTLNNQNT